MLPSVVRMQVAAPGRNAVRVAIPLFLVWLLLLPVVLVLLPLIFVVAALADFNILPALRALWILMTSLGGTHVEVDAPDARVFFHVL
jgi:hypothetical protein